MYKFITGYSKLDKENIRYSKIKSTDIINSMKLAIKKNCRSQKILEWLDSSKTTERVEFQREASDLNIFIDSIKIE